MSANARCIATAQNDWLCMTHASADHCKLVPVSEATQQTILHDVTFAKDGLSELACLRQEQDPAFAPLAKEQEP